MRRATGAIGQLQCIHGNFYPRSPCGERPGSVRGISSSTAISIHALLAESDNVHPDIRQLYAISIHALLAESDSWVIASVLMLHHFYPRSPCGERLDCISDYCIHHGFLSTLSLRRATAVLHVRGHHLRFLSTLSLRRATSPTDPRQTEYQHFYPRSPCGERHKKNVQKRPQNGFLSTLSLRRATPIIAPAKRQKTISIHALLAESDGRAFLARPFLLQFLSTLSLRRATKHS